jgi:very-short-patch-repair endonuclease
MLHNRKYLKEFRKELRSNLTPAEAELWNHLKGSRLNGRKFRRQHSIENFILDFYCPSERLAIELDGQIHYNTIAEQFDADRDETLKSLGIKVIRFENKEVFQNLEGILQEIAACFSK